MQNLFSLGHRLLLSILLRTRPSTYLWFGVFLVALGLSGPTAHGAALKEAQVSQVVKDVKLLPAQAASRAASLHDEVRDGTAVRTGVESRAELTFTDATLARLGANTIFNFEGGTRSMEMEQGTMLLQVPKKAGSAL